jgi:CBS domain-containing protein
MLSEIVNRDLVTVQPDTRLVEVARLMKSRNVGSVLVLNAQGRPRGMLTDRDIVVRCVAEDLDVSDTTVENVLSETLETCFEHEGIFDCIRKMRSAGVRRIPVVDLQGRAVGILSYDDLVALLSQELFTLTGTIKPAARRAA